MADKILQVKKEMKRLIKAKELSRIERYELLEKKTEELDKKEMRILINECKRDYQSYDRSDDIKELITISLTAMGMIITILGIFLEDRVMEFFQFKSIMVYTVIVVVIILLGFSKWQSYRSNCMNTTTFMLDILEEQYKKRFATNQ